MELQWPLILFTLFISWAAGLFATQSIYALKGEAAKAQATSAIVAIALTVIGGIAVFFHLEHAERIFNGFGHLSSGITQELIAIVIMLVLIVVTLSMARRNEGKVPAWLAIVNIVVALILIFVMGHSYMMVSRPAWNSILEVISLLGAACVLGPATFAIIEAIKGQEASAFDGLLNVIGSIVALVTTLAYLLSMNAIKDQFISVGYSYDPTAPFKAMPDAAAISPFAGGSATASILAIVCAAAAVAFAFVGKKKGNWKVWGALIVVVSIIACVALRIVFYNMGVDMYMLY
ncbi:MAG: dimethyl sulfoxide reductase anchor subunit [Coriobacteriales bacterium]|nr:dimethyl sulfoxide reductase anchor subunit [Coriobacteriales bacterium]